MNKMSLEILKAKDELRSVIDTYAILGDNRQLAEQLELFTHNAMYIVYKNGNLIGTTVGRDAIEANLKEHMSQLATSFTLIGQSCIEIDGNNAKGVCFSHIKVIRAQHGKSILTEYSIRYEDIFVRLKGKWLFQARVCNFIIEETRVL